MDINFASREVRVAFIAYTLLIFMARGLSRAWDSPRCEPSFILHKLVGPGNRLIPISRVLYLVRWHLITPGPRLAVTVCHSQSLWLSESAHKTTNKVKITIMKRKLTKLSLLSNYLKRQCNQKSVPKRI